MQESDRRCPQCGASVALVSGAAASFCPQRGARLPQAEEARRARMSAGWSSRKSTDNGEIA